MVRLATNPVAAPEKGTNAMTASQIAETLFARYNDHDAAAMVALFEPGGIVEYVPAALAGPVEEVGAGSWAALFDAFPDLRNRVNAIREADGGRTAIVDVNVMGTQAREVFGVPSQGKAYDLRHLFVVETNAAGRITHLTGFWDNAGFYRQLGKTDLD